MTNDHRSEALARSAGSIGQLLRSAVALTGRQIRREFLGWSVFVGGYVGILVFFGAVDVYDQHFFDRTYSPLYNVFRTLFVFYFFWLTYAVGAWSLRAMVPGSLETVRIYERLALGFFVGAVVLTLLLLLMGYLYLYWRIVAAVLTTTIVAFSWRLFSDTLAAGRLEIAQSLKAGTWLDHVASVAFAAAAICAAALLLFVKGLYPQGGHDYFLHYFQYYTSVVDNHHVWPNNFWVHYYLSKGMGLMFLGMLLTDPLAPSLVTFSCALATSLALFSLVRRFCPQTCWPWLAVLLYLSFSIHTLGSGAYRGHGGWGHYQKPHEVNSAFLFAILWMSVSMVRSATAHRSVWTFGAVACSFAVPYLIIVSAGIVGLFALLSACGFLLARHSAAKGFAAIFIAAGTGTASVLTLNYLTTGAPTDLGANLWWPIVDLGRLAEIGALADFAWASVLRAHAATDTNYFSSGFNFIEFLVNFSRFDVLKTLLEYSLLGAIAFALCAAILRFAFPAKLVVGGTANLAATAVILAFVGAVAVFTAVAGLSEAISYVRLTSFMLPLLIALAAITWQIAILAVRWPSAVRFMLAIVAPAAVSWISLERAYDTQKATLGQVVANAVRFVDGQYSIYDAARDQAGWPALPQSTSIYPGMFSAWKSVGPGKRIWTLHMHSYCMLPGCRPENLYSSIMSKNRTEVFFGSPERAREVLKREALNYFFVSTVLELRGELLQCSPLFAADTLADYFDLQWSDGKDALLTWKGEGTAPLTQEWVEKYRQAIEPNKFVPDCAIGMPFFMSFDRILKEEIAKGKRWGAQVPLP